MLTSPVRMLLPWMVPPGSSGVSNSMVTEYGRPMVTAKALRGRVISPAVTVKRPMYEPSATQSTDAPSR